MNGTDYDAILKQMDASSGSPSNSSTNYDSILKQMDSDSSNQKQQSVSSMRTDIPTFNIVGGSNKEPKQKDVLQDLKDMAPGIPVRASAGLVGLPQTLLSMGRNFQENHPSGLPPSMLDKANSSLIDVLTGRKNIPFTNTKIPNIGDVVSSGWDKLTGGVTSQQPQTPVGRVSDFTGQVMLGGGKPSVSSIGSGAVVGATGGVAGEATKEMGGTGGQQTLAQIAATLAAGVLMAKRGGASKLAKQTLDELTPAQKAEAQSSIDTSLEMKSPITSAEAIAQASGNTNLLRAQQAAEAGKNGGELRRIMNERPEANRSAFKTMADKISERSPDSAQVPGRMQAAAEGYLKDLEKARTEATSPNYQAQRNIDEQVIKSQKWLSDLKEQQQAAMQSRDLSMNEFGRRIGYANKVSQKTGYPLEQSDLPGAPKGPIGADYDALQSPRPELPSSDIEKNFAPGRMQVSQARSMATLGLPEIEQRTAEIKRLQPDIDRLSNNVPPNQENMAKDVAEMINGIKRQKTLAGPEEMKSLNWLEKELQPNGSPAQFPTQLNSIYQTVREASKKSAINADFQERRMAGVLGPYADRLEKLLTSSSEEIKQGKKNYADISKQIIEPANRDIVGQIAATPTGVGITGKSQYTHVSNVLMPKGGQPGLTPGAIEKNVSILNSKDPTAARDFVRENLQSIFDESAKDYLKSGRAQLGAAKFAESIAGNPTQRENLQALIKSAGSEKASKGFMKMIDAFMAQGEHLPPSKVELPGGVIPGSEVAKFGITRRLDILAGGVVNKFDNWIKGRTSKEIVNALTSKDGMSALERLANEKPGTARFNALIGAAVGSEDKDQ